MARNYTEAYFEGSELQPMIPYANAESPPRPMTLKRFITKFCTSRIGIRAVSVSIITILTVYLIFPKTAAKNQYFNFNELQNQREDEISAVPSLMYEPELTVSVPSTENNMGSSNEINIETLATSPQTSKKESISVSPKTISSSNSKVCQIENFTSDRCPTAETDFNTDELLDILKLPHPTKSNSWNKFDDDPVKIELTSRLEPKVWSKENKLKIFVVLHSHNDPGWLLPFKKYYSEQTKFILDYMLKYLTDDPELKFIWCEMSFFSLWWNDLTFERRGQVKKLVENKQLEFVGGGWVMPDEANVHYLSYFTQLIEGHQFLKQHLNYTAKNGWAIDPFGISASLNYLQGQARINATVFNRIHYILKQFLRERKSVEFLWRQQWDSSGSSDVFSYLMPYYSYDSTQTCGPDSKYICKSYKNPPGRKNYIPHRSIAILNQLRKKSLIFKTNNLLWPVGGDFHWKTEIEWTMELKNLKDMIKYINSNDTLFTEIKFATLDEYFQAVRGEIQRDNFQPPTLSGDFFTYSGERLDYWSGYFTSRMFHKTSERQLMSSLRSAQLLFTIMTAEVAKHWQSLDFQFIGDSLKALIFSRRTLSLFQHHDGITGTSKAKVVIDYAQMLFDSMLMCQFVQQQSMFLLSNLKKFKSKEYALEDIKTDAFYDPIFVKAGSYQNNWKLSAFEVNETTPFRIVTVFNPLEVGLKQLIQVGVQSANVKVVTLNDEEVESEVYPIFVLQRNDTMSAKDNSFELNFLASLKALEVKNYKLVYKSESSNSITKPAVKIFNAKSQFISTEFTKSFNSISASQEPKSSKDAHLQISNSHVKVTFSDIGTASTLQINGISHPLNLAFRYYKSKPGSGVYSFNPNGEQSYSIKVADPPIVIVEGKLKSYVEVWLPTVRHKLTLYNTKGFEDYALDIKNTIDITKQRNYELLMRMTTNISSTNTFYTDSNGFQMMRRKTRKNIPIQGNYYPVPSSAFIEDSQTRLTILTAQPGAGASFKSGELEIIQDRIVHMDDGHGMGEGGIDNLETISKYKVLLEEITTSDQTSEENEFVPFLSLAAHHHINSLLHPVMGFVLREKKKAVELENLAVSNDANSTRKVEETKPKGKALEGEIKVTNLKESPITDSFPGSNVLNPCDVFLAAVNPLPEYRSSQDDVNDTKIFLNAGDVGLLFHRVGYDGRFSSKSMLERCSLLKEDSGRLQINNIFKDLFESVYKRTSLTFVHEDGDISNDVIELEKMNVLGVIAKYRYLQRNPWKNPILFDVKV